MGELEVHDVDAGRWGDLARLFEARGGPKHCWCSVWRDWRGAPGTTDRERKRATLEGQVRTGVPVGLIGYVEGEPAAWCSVAPRESFRELGGVADEAGEVWSLVCFFVPRKRRGAGLARQLLEAAVARAREAGAGTLEAYPVDPDSPSYRFMGFRPMFLARGFEERGTAGSRRYVMRLDLQGGR